MKSEITRINELPSAKIAAGLTVSLILFAISIWVWISGRSLLPDGALLTLGRISSVLCFTSSIVVFWKSWENRNKDIMKVKDILGAGLLVSTIMVGLIVYMHNLPAEIMS